MQKQVSFLFVCSQNQLKGCVLGKLQRKIIKSEMITVFIRLYYLLKRKNLTSFLAQFDKIKAENKSKWKLALRKTPIAIKIKAEETDSTILKLLAALSSLFQRKNNFQKLAESAQCYIKPFSKPSLKYF